MIKHSYWIWKNVFNLIKIKELNKFIKSNYHRIQPKEDGVVEKKHLSTKHIFYKSIKPYVEDIVYMCIKHNNLNIGYDIWNIEDKDCCNYNEYKKGSNYDWHLDINDSPYADRKLTILINLSEEKYDGGDLLIQDTNEYILKDFKDIGSVVMFKSFLRHKVTPIIQGNRKNLALFLEGPSFR